MFTVPQILQVKSVFRTPYSSLCLTETLCISVAVALAWMLGIISKSFSCLYFGGVAYSLTDESLLRAQSVPVSMVSLSLPLQILSSPQTLDCMFPAWLLGCLNTKSIGLLKAFGTFFEKRNNILITTDMPAWSPYPLLWQFSLETTLLHFSNFITIWLRDCYFALATDFISCPVHLCPRYTCEMTSSVSACQ